MLPIEEVYLTLLKAFEHNNIVLLNAPPGAGKSTWLPLQLLRDQHFDKMTDFDMMVVDVTLAPEEAVERVSRLKQHLGDQNAAVVLALSGGSSAKMISLTVTQFAELAPTVGLTKLDECETTATEFSALAESGARVSLLSGTKSVVGAIAFASAKILAQYLKENFQTDATDNPVF